MSTQEETRRIQEVIKNNDYNDTRASVLLPYQDTTPIELTAQKYRGCEALVIIGIGGSNLGTWAVHEAIHGELHNETAKTKVYFADTTDAHQLTKLQQRLETIQGRTVYVVISKSGTTAETIANASILVKDWSDAIIITGKNSLLDGLNGASTLHIQEQIGGRYSVFSAVGLLPLAILGININQLLAGARGALENLEAIAQQVNKEHEANKQITEAFFFAPLQRLGQWRRQLIAESLGKNGKGPLPTTRIGSTDLHSTAQRSLDGPNDTYTTFITVEETPTIPIPNNKTSQLVEDLADKTTKQLLEAIQEATMKAYEEANRPYKHLTLQKIHEKSIGALMQTMMLETMLQANLLGINAFDQPAVENYKKHTKENLKQL
ncbi:MAG: hypothetical protein ACMXYD_00155 [Candidatus Woesearchaeota archaeon]